MSFGYLLVDCARELQQRAGLPAPSTPSTSHHGEDRGTRTSTSDTGTPSTSPHGEDPCTQTNTSREASPRRRTRHSTSAHPCGPAPPAASPDPVGGSAARRPAATGTRWQPGNTVEKTQPRRMSRPPPHPVSVSRSSTPKTESRAPDFLGCDQSFRDVTAPASDLAGRMRAPRRVLSLHP